LAILLQTQEDAALTDEVADGGGQVLFLRFRKAAEELVIVGFQAGCTPAPSSAALLPHDSLPGILLGGVMAQPADDERFTEIRELARKWLTEDGYAVQDLDQLSMAWLLVAHGEQGEYGVGQSRERPAIISITSLVDLRLIGPRLSEVDDALLWRLRLGLLSLGLDSFSGLDRPLGRVTLGADVYCEELSRNDLAQAMRRVRHAIPFLLWSIRYSRSAWRAGYIRERGRTLAQLILSQSSAPPSVGGTGEKGIRFSWGRWPGMLNSILRRSR